MPINVKMQMIWIYFYKIPLIKTYRRNEYLNRSVTNSHNIYNAD